MKKVIIQTNEKIQQFNTAAKQFIKENYGSIAFADNSGTITVISSSKKSGWGASSSIENAKMILEHLHRDDCGFVKATI